MSQSLALFDFDGTITSRDSLFEFVHYSKGPLKYYVGILMLSPMLLFYKLRIIPGWRVKEMLLTYFFGGMALTEFQSLCKMFSTHRLPTILRVRAMGKIKNLLENNARVVVVSASPENWVSEWARSNDVECIATRLEVKNNVITGKLSGKNCIGEEKVNRIKEYIDISSFSPVYTYGDTNHDWPMLKLGTYIHYKPFR